MLSIAAGAAPIVNRRHDPENNNTRNNQLNTELDPGIRDARWVPR